MYNLRRTLNQATNKEYYFINSKRVSKRTYDNVNGANLMGSFGFNTEITKKFITHTHTVRG